VVVREVAAYAEVSPPPLAEGYAVTSPHDPSAYR